MQVCDGLEETHYFPKIGIDINLLKRGLGESILIRFIFCIGPTKELFTIFPHAFMSEIGPAVSTRFLAKSESIFPSCRGVLHRPQGEFQL